MEYESVQFIVEYDNPEHPFAESPTRTRFFETSEKMLAFINAVSPEERVLKGFKQTTYITREYFIGQE